MLIIWFFLLLNLNLYSSNGPFEDRLAIVIVPVADAARYPFQLLDFSKPIEEIYKEFPFAPEKGKYSCLRMHQLLFNEKIIIKQQLKDEVECEVFNVFYDENGKKNRTFWTLKKWVKTHNNLKNHGIDLTKFPEPFTENKDKSLNGTLTLVKPWHDPITNQSYSAGTRFVRNASNDKKNGYSVFIYDINKVEFQESFVEKNNALVKYPKNLDEFKKLFVRILKNWANQQCILAYLFGGCSFINTYDENNFSFINNKRFGEPVSYWIRYQSEFPFSGIDCSGLILRVAQICGMPYFYKNTNTLINYLDFLKPEETIKEGDLIWYCGHVLIVSDIKNNKVIEAAGYKSGFGKIHEITLNKVFKNINNYSDLVQAYRYNLPLKRLDCLGRVTRNINKISILKLDNLWH